MLTTKRRERYRLGLNGLYLPFYDKLCGRLGPEWDPYSGERLFYEQDCKYAQGRTAPGRVVTNARGGESPHNYGCASDWTIWKDGQPVWIEAEDPRWKEYVEAVTAVGLRPGAEFGDIDHNELRITVRWKEVHNAFNRGGMSVAFALIKQSMAA